MKEGKFGLLAMAFVVFVVTIARAETYFWQGDRNADPTALSNYKDASGDSPASFDGIDVSMKSNGQEVSFTDASLPTLRKMNSFNLTRYAKMFIAIDRDWEVDLKPHYPDAAKFDGIYGTILKSGSGTLELAHDDSSGTASAVNLYHEQWEVQGGRLAFPQENIRGKVRYACGRLSVSNGCEVVLFGSRSAPDRVYNSVTMGFCGAGDILYTNTVRDCYLYTEGTAPAPFSGRIVAPLAQLRPSEAILSGTNNVYSGNQVLGTLAGRLLGNDGDLASPNSFGGASSITTLNAADVVIRNLGTEADGPQTTNRRYKDAYETGSGTVTFDAGSYGDLTMSGGYLDTAFGPLMKELILTGDNSVRSTYANKVYARNGAADNGYYYLTKRGTGTWRIPSTEQEDLSKLAGIGVEEGVLEYETIAEQGEACSLGLAEAVHLHGYAYLGTIAAAPATVSYAIRLGTAGDLSKTGTLAYCGSTGASCTTRPIAVTGRGRLVNDTGKTLYLKGVRTVVPQEGGTVPPSNILVLDGSGAGSTLADLSEDDGAGSLTIEKQGAGTWSLDGDIAASGGVTVREGTLSVRNYDYYTWFRFTITQTRGGSDDADPNTGNTQQSELSDLALFDADGRRQNAGLKFSSTCNVGANEGKLSAGYATFGREWTDLSGYELAYLFSRPSGDTSKFWKAITKGHAVKADDEESHVPVVMHLAEGVEKVASLDFVHRHDPADGQKFDNLVPRQFTLEGSADGRTWHLVTNVTDLAVTDYQTTYHYSKATLGTSEAVTNALTLPDTAVPAAERHTVFADGIARLRVDRAATFRMVGSSAAVRGLEIDATGAGTVENVSFASAGTIEIVGVDPTASVVDVPYDFSGLEGSGSLSAWSVRINGSDAVTRRYACTVTPTGIRLSKKGLVLIVR